MRATIHRLPQVVIDDRIEYVRADLRLAEDCARAIGDCRYVFHCAAVTSGAAVIVGAPMTHVTPNIVMNALLLEAAYRAGVEKFLWIGSASGYPDVGRHAVTEDEFFNGDPHPVYYCVGWMKRFTEILTFSTS